MKKIIIGALFYTLNAFAAEPFDDKWLVRFTSDTTLMDATEILNEVGLETTNVLEEIQVHVAKPLEKFTEEKLLTLKSNVHVLYAEPNYKVTTDVKPNDPKLWSNTMRIREAWDVTTGSKNVVVAVSDTGVLWNHEDLANHIWTNSREIPDNGIDDDGNGYADDIHGWNFYSNTNNSNDDHKHGTHVAGIIGAEGNNGKGLAGVNWSVTIMPVKFLSKSGSGSSEGGIQTILYAVNNGARVINASWGGDGYSQAMYDALAYAYSKNVLFVAAAGNAGKNTDSAPHYPSGFQVPNIISVASASSSNFSSMQEWSNRGRRTVHIAAPGNQIMSCMNSVKGYMKMSGTSMASPAVAGIGALILSIRPELNVTDLRNAILNSAQGSSLTVSTRGFVNVEVAVTQFNGTPQVWPAQYSLGKTGSIQLTAYGFSGAVKWSVDHPEVASVSDTGFLQALKAGKIIVTAKGANNQVAQTRTIEILK